MHAAIKIFGGRKSRATRRRRLSAAAGAMAVIGVSAMLAAPSAYADNFEQYCNGYHSWTECISYDWSNGNLAVNALNGYSYAQTEALWIKVYGVMVANQGFNIPAHSWRGFPHFLGTGNSFSACAGIDDVQIVCGTFS